MLENAAITIYLSYDSYKQRRPVYDQLILAKSAHPSYEICPSNLRNMPIRPTKKCPSDLRKVPIRPTKNVNPTYEKCPSDLQKLPIPKIRPSVYRVSHMLLDRQRVLLRFSENLRTNNHLEKLNKTNIKISCEKS